MLVLMGQAKVFDAPQVECRDLAAVYRAHAEAVSRWARRLAGACTDADVEDVVHDVFLVVQRRLPEFRGDSQITTWLYAVTVHVVQNRRRRERLRRWLPLGGPRRDAVAALGPSPLQAVESRQATELTYRILDRLSETDRTMLILFELDGLSGGEIAAITGISPARIWVRLHRARARFRKVFLELERKERP